MKKIILASIMMLSFGITGCASSQEFSELKAQQKALKLQTQLTNTQLEYEKAVVNLAEVKRKASAVNAEANNSVVTGLSTRNPEASAKAGKDRVKILKEANKMNKKVAKEEKKVEKLQKKIEKLQGEIDKLRQKVEFVGRW